MPATHPPQPLTPGRETATRWRSQATAAVLLAGGAHLAWEHLHGGILRHHLLARADLPALSNAWGLLLLPGLTWYLTGRIQRRCEAPGGPPARTVAAFAGSLLYGALLSGGFRLGFTSFTELLFQGLLALALLLPIHRSECVLGFVLGMTFVFGGVLPTAVASILSWPFPG